VFYANVCDVPIMASLT